MAAPRWALSAAGTSQPLPPAAQLPAGSPAPGQGQVSLPSAGLVMAASWPARQRLRGGAGSRSTGNRPSRRYAPRDGWAPGWARGLAARAAGGAPLYSRPLLRAPGRRVAVFAVRGHSSEARPNCSSSHGTRLNAARSIATLQFMMCLASATLRVPPNRCSSGRQPPRAWLPGDVPNRVAAGAGQVGRAQRRTKGPEARAASPARSARRRTVGAALPNFPLRSLRSQPAACC